MDMKSPSEMMAYLKQNIKKEWKTAFLTALVLGLCIHMPMMMRDIPNHDGLDSMHFDQNMITSGRWFLSVACGVSSYYTLPWLIGLLSVLYLGFAAAALVEFLDLKSVGAIVTVSGLLVSFPTLASTFAYIFTMDGYMLAVFLAILSVLLTKKYKKGFIGGGICLAFSMGIYQSYLAFAVLLSIFGILMIAMEQGAVREKILRSLKYLYMGIIGAGGYYVILQVLLKIQGKELASYQGISDMGTVEGAGIVGTIKKMYSDFFAFTFEGNVLMNNVFSVGALMVLAMLFAGVLVACILKKKWWKSLWLYILLGLLAVGLPIASNMILFISPDVTYHALMRYQWVLYPILLVAFVDRACKELGGTKAGWKVEEASSSKNHVKIAWVECFALLAAGILTWNYAVTDNIAYSNLQKKYEKTYAYCIRLLDRIEQTEGYYQGMPIAMVGVVGDEAYPVTDITQDVTSNLIGMNGDYLIYTGQNYKLFMEHYLGASLNILPPEAMADMYYDARYVQMNSFPAADSIQIMDGIMYIKTENMDSGLLGN